MIKRNIVETYMERLYCDDCNEEMLPSGVVLASNPPQYPHVCKRCGKTENVIDKKFPNIEYKEIE